MSNDEPEKAPTLRNACVPDRPVCLTDRYVNSTAVWKRCTHEICGSFVVLTVNSGRKGGGAEGMGMQVHLVRYVIWRDSAHIEAHRLARQHKLVAVQQTVTGTGFGCMADGLVDFHGRRFTAGTLARVGALKPAVAPLGCAALLHN